MSPSPFALAALLLLGCGGTQAVDAALDRCQKQLGEVAIKCAAQPKADKPCPVPSKAAVVNQITDESLVQLITESGYELVGQRAGVIRFRMHRVDVVINNSGGNMQLYAAFIANQPQALPVINDWNRTKRYSRAYVDSDGDPVLESDLDLRGGVSKNAIHEFIRTFGISVRAYQAVLYSARRSPDGA